MREDSFNELIYFIQIFMSNYKKEFFSDWLTNYAMRMFTFNNEFDKMKKDSEKEKEKLSAKPE